MQVVVEGIRFLHRAIDSAPVDSVRHEEVHNPMQVQLSRHPPSGGFVFVFKDQDLPFGGLGQVRFVVGEFVARLRVGRQGRGSPRQVWQAPSGDRLPPDPGSERRRRSTSGPTCSPPPCLGAAPGPGWPQFAASSSASPSPCRLGSRRRGAAPRRPWQARRACQTP